MSASPVRSSGPARALIAVALLALPSAAQATVLFDWGVDELARRADRVVIGTVESQTTVEVGRTLMTDTRIRIERTLAGSPAQTITVRQLGGRLGDRIVDVPGDAVLVRGRRYLLFTAQPPGDLHRYLVGMALGALEVGDTGVLTQTVDVPLVAPSGALREAPGPRFIERAAIEAAIRAARAPASEAGPRVPEARR